MYGNFCRVEIKFLHKKVNWKVKSVENVNISKKILQGGNKNFFKFFYIKE